KPSNLIKVFTQYFKDGLPSAVICCYDGFWPAYCKLLAKHYGEKAEAAALNKCYMKNLMRKSLRKNKLDSTAFFKIISLKDIEKLENKITISKSKPWILKPAFGSASEFVSPPLTSFARLWRYFSLWLKELPKTSRRSGAKWNRTLLLEEFVDGEEYSIEGVAHGKNIAIAGVFQKQGLHFLGGIRCEGVNFTPADDRNKENKIIELARNAVKSIGLRKSAFHIEMRWDKTHNKPVIIEINPRIPGGLLCRIHREKNKFNLAKALLSAKLGEKNPPSAGKKLSGIFGDLPIPARKKGVYLGYGKKSVSFNKTDVEFIDFIPKDTCIDPFQREVYFAHGYVKSNNKKDFWRAVNQSMKLKAKIV
ncbi:MAG: ATP-grasp domain-containing protein, partial [Elusimicrobia bacterium]|nr:ATP-grasp domain-containing protein [Elusimicrobiota bacterium]